MAVEKIINKVGKNTNTIQKVGVNNLFQNIEKNKEVFFRYDVKW